MSSKKENLVEEVDSLKEEELMFDIFQKGNYS